MPSKPLIDLSRVDTSNILADREAIGQINPHRFELAQLDAVCLMSPETEEVVGYRDVRPDEFWVRGHIPGRPLFPGVLMIETAAQLVSYFVGVRAKKKGFLAFTGVEGVKFRGTVVPGDRIIMVGLTQEVRVRRCISDTQAFVNGQMVFEGKIIGMWI
jgi:3-hydroxyacyl-[acyl-carrier-protein] dehydratase